MAQSRTNQRMFGLQFSWRPLAVAQLVYASGRQKISPQKEKKKTLTREKQN